MTPENQLLTHPIYLAFKALDEAWEPTSTQVVRILAADNPAQEVALLPGRMVDVKEDVARYLTTKGIRATPDDILNHEALRTLTDFEGRTSKGGQDEKQAVKIGPAPLVRIGMRLAQKHAVEAPLTAERFVAAMYELFLGRSADDGGFKHYADRLNAGGAGNGIYDIIHNIWFSEEARRRRGETVEG